MQAKLTNVSFAQSLYRLMEMRAVSNADVARAVGVSKVAIGNYLKGRVPRAEILEKLAGFFGTQSGNLLKGDVRIGELAQEWTAVESVIDTMLETTQGGQLRLTGADHERGFVEVALEYRADETPKGFPRSAVVKKLDTAVASLLFKQMIKQRTPYLPLLASLPPAFQTHDFLDRLTPLNVSSLVNVSFHLSYGARTAKNLFEIFEEQLFLEATLSDISTKVRAAGKQDAHRPGTVARKRLRARKAKSK